MATKKTKERPITVEGGFRRIIEGTIELFMGIFEFFYAILKNIIALVDKKEKEK